MPKPKSLRLHHTHRQIKKHQKDTMYIYADKSDDEFLDGKGFKMRVITPVLCSCIMCGNPRKFYGNGKDSKTLQELKAVNDEKFGLQEYWICDQKRTA